MDEELEDKFKEASLVLVDIVKLLREISIEIDSLNEGEKGHTYYPLHSHLKDSDGELEADRWERLRRMEENAKEIGK